MNARIVLATSLQTLLGLVAAWQLIGVALILLAGQFPAGVAVVALIKTAVLVVCVGAVRVLGRWKRGGTENTA